MSNHLELAISINPLCAEIVSDFLINELKCSGVVMEETEYEDLKITKQTKNLVKGYIWNNPDQDLSTATLQNLLWSKKAEWNSLGISKENLGSWNLTITEIQDEQWAHSWKKYWHPMKISEKIVICPSWEEYELKENEIKIELDPGSAFGTGTHPTTRLCVNAMEKYLNKDDSIADVGSGSGILSIAGLKLGAKSVIGVDNDPSVINVSIENAQKNELKDKTTFYEGSAKDIKGQYDLIVSNILAHVLIDIMDDLKALMHDDSNLILSGIISEKAEDVIQKLQECGLKHIETLTEDNWVAIIAEK